LFAMKCRGFQVTAGRLKEPQPHRLLAARTHHNRDWLATFRHERLPRPIGNYVQFQHCVED
jgi:hypothetical protein